MKSEHDLVDKYLEFGKKKVSIFSKLLKKMAIPLVSNVKGINGDIQRSKYGASEPACVVFLSWWNMETKLADA